MKQHRMCVCRSASLSVFTICLLLSVFLGNTAKCETITLEYNFTAPEISKTIINGEKYDRVIMKDASNGGDIGHPSLPSMGTRVLLPFGEDFERIEILASEKIDLGSGYKIEPVARPYPISKGPTAANWPVPDPAIYNYDAPYPADKVVNTGIHSMRGYRQNFFRLQPVEYLPLSGNLYYYPRITLIIHTQTSNKSGSHELLRSLPEDEMLAKSKVANPETSISYLTAAKSVAKGYELLIITTPELESSFLPLKDYHDTTGILAELHTTDMIGSTNPPDVRDYIRDRYLNDGIHYVLIGGDDDLIPALDVFVISWAGEGSSVETDMPCDMYFGCLDGSWDSNGNGIYGEPVDGDGGGDVDLVAEVYVGRAPVGDINEADIFVNKTIQYLSQYSYYLKNVLMVGEHLGFGGLGEYAAYSLDALIDGANPFGIQSDVYDVDRLYDRDWPGNYWPTSEVVNRINAGVHILNHFGHGWEHGAMKMYDASIQGYLTNADELYFFYSQACLSGHFDGMDCWAEHMHIKGNDGAFAMVMNARYGWGTTNSNNGPSQKYNLQFWDAVFSPSENKPEMGWANHDSKEDLIHRLDENCMRWCTYELNLLGDPTIAFKIPRNLTFSYPGGIPGIVDPDEITTFEIVVTGLREGEPVPGSGTLSYKINEGNFLTIPLTELSDNHYQVFLPAVDCGGYLSFYVGAEESTMGYIYDPGQDQANRAVSATITIDLLDDNFETDQGWTISGNAMDGLWERGVPVGGGDRGDPATDFDGSGCCYLTGNSDGNSDIEYGLTCLNSPVFDATTGDYTAVEYARWFCNDLGELKNMDDMNIFISNDNGQHWTLVEQVGPALQSSGGWYTNKFWVSDFVAPTDQMRVQFEAASELGDDEIVEAAVDAVHITTYLCNPYICGDSNMDESINIGDAVHLLTHIFMEGPAPDPIEAGNCNCDTGVNIGDAVYLLTHIFSEGPVPCQDCPE